MKRRNSYEIGDGQKVGHYTVDPFWGALSRLACYLLDTGSLIGAQAAIHIWLLKARAKDMSKHCCLLVPASAIMFGHFGKFFFTWKIASRPNVTNGLTVLCTQFCFWNNSLLVGKSFRGKVRTVSGRHCYAHDSYDTNWMTRPKKQSNVPIDRVSHSSNLTLHLCSWWKEWTVRGRKCNSSVQARFILLCSSLLTLPVLKGVSRKRRFSG